MRRTLTIIAVAVVFIGLLVGIYFLFFADSSGITVENGVSSGNPFGTGGSDVNSSGSGDSAGSSGNAPSGSAATGGTATQVAPHLVLITASPVASGFIALDASTTPVVSVSTTTASTSPAETPSFGALVRYIDRESGNMYEYDAAQGTTERLTDHTAPGVQEASWLPDGSLAYIRFLTTDPDSSEHIDTYALPADGTTGYLLARDLSAVIPQGLSSLFTLMPNTSGSVGTLSKPDGSGSSTLFSSPLSAIRIASAGPAGFVAFTKPSAEEEGYAFLVNGKSGSFQAILGPYLGLSVLPSPSGKTVLFSYETDGALSLAFMDLATRTVTTLPVATLAEKCAWTPDSASVYCAVPSAIPSDATLPDDWYQGAVAFSDKLWRIDFTARVATLAADLTQLSQVPIDATALTLDPNESTLVFMNKQDDSLWSYSF